MQRRTRKTQWVNHARRASAAHFLLVSDGPAAPGSPSIGVGLRPSKDIPAVSIGAYMATSSLRTFFGRTFPAVHLVKTLLRLPSTYSPPKKSKFLVSAFTPLFAPGIPKTMLLLMTQLHDSPRLSELYNAQLQQVTFLDPGQSVDLHRRHSLRCSRVQKSKSQIALRLFSSCGGHWFLLPWPGRS